MSKKITKKDNYLELIPVKNDKFNSRISEESIVSIIIKRDGFVDKLVRPFAKTPKEMVIDLDRIGSFIWNTIDGKKDIEEISRLVENHFGEEIQPLIQRLGKYINLLRNNSFITLEKVSE